MYFMARCNMRFEFDALLLPVCLVGFELLNGGLAEFASHGKSRCSGELGRTPVGWVER